MSVNPVIQVQSLITTFLSYRSPSSQNLNTMVSGIISVLKGGDLTSDQSNQILSMLTDVLTKQSFLSKNRSYEFAAEELSQMSTSTNKQFFTTISPIFAQSSTISASQAANIAALIKTKQESTTTLSRSDYASLWKLFGLTDQNIEDQWNATLTLYFNLNYSNYMSKTLSETTIDDWKSNLISTLSSKYDLGANLSTITSLMNTIFTDNGLTSSSGMSTLQFMNASDDFLALLSTYLSSSDIKDVRAAISSYISDSFLTSSTYCDTMSLSSAESLSSSVSSNFSITNLPFTSTLAESYKTSVLSSLTSAYSFSSSEQTSIQNEINTYFSSINYSKNGMTADQTYALWTNLQTTITPFLTDATKDLSTIKVSFLNNLQTYILKNVSQILSAKTLIHDDGQEFIFANPSTGTETFTGNYLSDWAAEFLTKVGQDLTTTEKTVLNSCLEDLMNTNNNVASGVSGNNFIQIGCEILLWLSTFLDQSNINEIAQNMQGFLLTFVYVSNYVQTVDEVLEIFGLTIAIALLIVGLVLITLFSLGTLDYPFIATIAQMIILATSIAAAGAAATAGISLALSSTIKNLCEQSSWDYAIATSSVLGFFIFAGFGEAAYYSIDPDSNS